MSRPTTLRSPWREAAERAGGVVALAEALGVDRMTLWRWAARTREPPALMREAVNARFRRWGLAEPF